MAISFVLAIGDSVLVMSINWAMLISRPQTFDFSIDKFCHTGQNEVEQGSTKQKHKGNIQQKILTERNLIHSRTEVMGSVMAENVVYPVSSPIDRVAGLILMNFR